MTEQTTTIWSLVGQIVFIMLAGGGLLLLERIRQKAMDWYKQRKLHPIARSVLANKEVNSLLIELRAKTDSDRASVFLFHNGQTFSNKNPLWRISCTQECSKLGTSHEISSLQNMLASLVWDGLAPLFGDAAACGAGVCEYAVPDRKMKIYQMNVHKMSDSFFKRSMMARGVRILYITPISDSHKEIVGYISLDYCFEAEPVPEEIIVTLAEAAGNIHFALTAA